MLLFFFIIVQLLKKNSKKYDICKKLHQNFMKKNNLFFTALFACILFFAGCKKEEYVVTFNPNGGKGAIVTQNFTGKIAQSLMANSFTNKGHTFKGWNTKPDGSGTAYEDQETIKVSGHMVLYAQWKEAIGEFTVTFNANGGEGEMEQQQFEPGVIQALSPNAFYHDDYTFTGWCTAANGGGRKFSNQQMITITTDMTLYAQWSRISQTFFVTFFANGGTGTMEPQEFIEGVTQNLDSNTFERNNYIFLGWNTDEKGEGKLYVNKQKIFIHSNMRLYAQWAQEPEPCPGTPTVKDVDGNTYNTVKVGSQCWMRENLKTTKYQTEEVIPVIFDYLEWNALSAGALCFYNNDTTNFEKYGALYNGFAANTGILCPAGWKIPSNSDWETLALCLGGVSNAGYYMKTSYDWNSNGNGINSSDFSALPAGRRFYNTSNYSEQGTTTGFWSEENNSNTNKAVSLYSFSYKIEFSNINIRNGHSVRCIKN
jgi:uncharacterized protein (TIGR02145 family)/uncharacterized repeat protein (TIGR02543 family)